MTQTPDEAKQANAALQLSALGVQFHRQGNRVKACAATEQAIALFRQLAQANPHAFTPGLVTSLNNLGAMLSVLGRRKEALGAAVEATALSRQLAKANPKAFIPDLAMSLNNLGNRLSDLGRRDEALVVVVEAVALRRQLAQANPHVFTPNLAISLGNLGNKLRDLGRREEALSAAIEATDLDRQLAQANPQAFTPNLAASLNNLGAIHRDMGLREEALAVATEAAALRRQLAHSNPQAFTPDLAMSLNNVSAMLSDLGRRAEALAAAVESTALRRQLAQADPQAFTPGLAMSLSNLGNMLSDLGRREEALAAAVEATTLRRQLAQADPQAFTPDLAMSLNNLGNRLRDLGRRDEALVAAVEANSLYRQLAQANPQAFTPGLAMSLSNLSSMLSDLGRREEALAVAVEATDLRRKQAETNPQAFTPDLAKSLNNLGNRLSDLGRHEEALAAAVEATDLCRQLAQVNPHAFTPDLAMILNNLGSKLRDLGRRGEALAAAIEATDLHRQLAKVNPQAFTPDLASSLNNLGNMLSDLGRREEALAAAVEAANLYRQLARDNPQAFSPVLAIGLNNLGNRLGDLGRREEALAATIEACKLLLHAPAYNPTTWVRDVRNAVRNLQNPSHVRNQLIPLLAGLTERRELAHDGAAAALFLDLQAELAAMVWRISTMSCGADPGLLDDALPTVVAVLQSPDLARWLADLAQDSPLKQDLAKCRADVKVADDALAAVLARVRGDAGGGGDEPGVTRQGGAGAPSKAEAERLALAKQQADALTDAKHKRSLFHRAQQRVMAEDPAYRAAHQVPNAQTLRAQAGALAPLLHGKASGAAGDAVLFLLALQGEDGGEDEAAGWMLFADGRPSRLLALPGVLKLASNMAQYQPVGNRQAATRLRRGMADVGPVAAAARSLVFAALVQDTQNLFWQPLASALDGHQVGTLHVCAHGPLHLLALGLGADADPAAAGKINRVVAWPGMPYLRLAADTAAGLTTSAPDLGAWQIGHDCAWAGEQPLPMAAVEAQLTASLLAAQQKAHWRLNDACALQPAGGGLVACCHGSQAAHLGSALALGQSALTVRQVVEHKLGAHIVLLPVCLAGETVQDPAGNALGLAAGFLLAGTRVVVGSSKGVPDLLIPWFTTLVLWHRVHGGEGAWGAATLARSQFAAGQFPDDFKQWLAGALPAALSALHTGGDEHPRLLAACVQLAGTYGRPQQVRSNLLSPITDAWPWQGDSAGLFSSDAAAHQAALASVAVGVLQPHTAKAESLRQAMREMAAFINIYGTD